MNDRELFVEIFYYVDYLSFIIFILFCLIKILGGLQNFNWRLNDFALADWTFRLI